MSLLSVTSLLKKQIHEVSASLFLKNLSVTSDFAGWFFKERGPPATFGFGFPPSHVLTSVQEDVPQRPKHGEFSKGNHHQGIYTGG